MAAQAAIPVENLAVSLQSVIRELEKSFCLSKKEDGIEVSILKDEVQVQLSVIAPAGLNSITRRTTTTTGEERTITNTGIRVSDDVDQPFTQSSEASAFVAITTSTKADGASKTTRKNPIKTSTTVQQSEPDVTTTNEVQSSTQDSERNAFGGDTTTRTSQYDTV